MKSFLVTRRFYWIRVACAALFVAMAARMALAGERIVLTVEQAPSDGLVLARVELREAARFAQVTIHPDRLRAFTLPGDKPVPVQFVPDPNLGTAGTIVMSCPPGVSNLWLDFSAVGQVSPDQSTTITNTYYRVVHQPGNMGGMPSEITFVQSGKKFEAFHWGDRLYHREAGQFWLRNDPQGRVECVSSGPLCKVIRSTALYTDGKGKRAPGEPYAVYDWYYFPNQPAIFVRGSMHQREPRAWHEAHFLEFGFRTNAFMRWAGGEPRSEGVFQANDQSHRFSRWAAVMDGRNALAMFDAGPISIYDGQGYGRYLHAQVDSAWQGWKTTAMEASAWLWIGSDANPAEHLGKLSAAKPARALVSVSTERLQKRINNLETELAKADTTNRARLGWAFATTKLLQERGRLQEALDLAPGQLPPEWTVLPAGDLRLVLEKNVDGIKVVSLVDAGTGKLLSSVESLPLFELTLNADFTNQVRLNSDSGWQKVTVEKSDTANAYTLQWQGSKTNGLVGLVVRAALQADPARHRLAWRLEAQGQSAPWSLWQIRFPQLALSSASPETQLLLPQAAGLLKKIGREPFNRFHGEYPSGWMSMQLAALYDPAVKTGLYFGVHDPVGSTKQFYAESGKQKAVHLIWDVPIPEMGRPANRFTFSGEAVWELLRGDWFDAALVYRGWVRREAKWFPTLGENGRSDTPPWMRELCVWAQTGGSPKDCVPRVTEFAKALGVPVGFHWYSWHQIPFDNDYPHYFPTRDGFTEGVKQLQEAGVFVMPYINGRLWDTHDRGVSDFEFTRIARPAATKNHKGEPYVESYGSKETNGEPVRLAVMCPTTPLWQERQHQIVMQLFTNCGVKAVYIDQIAAAKPELCMDPAHAHPLGGGSWWNEQGYWPMLEHMRRDKPADRMLTTECNAEPFLRWFDGYLTWHWQYDGQVPLFPAVYGGAVQMFGRAYRGGPTKDLALRMKAAQQLVWGEQLGWLEPSVVRETNNFPFFRDAARLRWHLREYFYAGQMARPPALKGEIPNVTADWQWSGVWPVTTPALMSGAWHLLSAHKIVLLFANVDEKAITAELSYDLAASGLAGNSFTRSKWTPAGESKLRSTGALLRETLTFAPRTLWAWELTAEK